MQSSYLHPSQKNKLKNGSPHELFPGAPGLCQLMSFADWSLVPVECTHHVQSISGRERRSRGWTRSQQTKRIKNATSGAAASAEPPKGSKCQDSEFQEKQVEAVWGFFFWQRGQELYPLSGALSSSSVYSDVNKLICYKEVSDCSEVCRPHRGKTPFFRERGEKCFWEMFQCSVLSNFTRARHRRTDSLSQGGSAGLEANNFLFLTLDLPSECFCHRALISLRWQTFYPGSERCLLPGISLSTSQGHNNSVL